MALICRIVGKRIAGSVAMYLGQNSVQPTAFQIHDCSIFFSHFSFFVVKYFGIFIFYLEENCKIFAVFVLEISSTE